MIRLRPSDERLDAEIEAADAAQLEEAVQVLEVHLDRFAFREAPLPATWTGRDA